MTHVQQSYAFFSLKKDASHIFSSQQVQTIIKKAYTKADDKIRRHTGDRAHAGTPAQTHIGPVQYTLHTALLSYSNATQRHMYVVAHHTSKLVTEKRQAEKRQAEKRQAEKRQAEKTMRLLECARLQSSGDGMPLTRGCGRQLHHVRTNTQQRIKTPTLSPCSMS